VTAEAVSCHCEPSGFRRYWTNQKKSSI